MVLSAEQIRLAIANGSLLIEPFEDASIKQASYTFHLGENLIVYPLDQVIEMDAREPVRQQMVIPKDGYLLQPGQFILASLLEHLNLDSSIGCLLSVRGSCAQIGLNALNSDLFIEPGWAGHVSLAIKNVNNVPIRIRFGMKVVKGIFLRI